MFGFCCPHYGDSAGHDKDLWTEFLQTVHREPNAVVFGLGDYLDWTRTTHRVPLKAVWGEDDKAFQTLDELVMDGLVYPFVDTIRKHCPSFAQKCVGLVEGNHHGAMLSSKFRNGQTTTEVICDLLGVRYLGLSAWVRLTVYRSLGTKKFGTGHNLNVLLNHSVSTSGQLSGSLATASRKLVGWRDVDIFLSGNDHQLGHELRQEIGCTRRGQPRMVQFQQVIGKCGSFQKGYLDGARPHSYVEKKLLKPSQLGWLEFTARIYQRELSDADRRASGRTNSPETWRFDEFSL